MPTGPTKLLPKGFTFRSTTVVVGFTDVPPRKHVIPVRPFTTERPKTTTKPAQFRNHKLNMRP